MAKAHLFTRITVADYISIPETARGQGVSPAAVTRWILTGAKLSNGNRAKLKAIRLPGGFRTTRQWVDEFIELLTLDRVGAPAPAEVHEERARRSEVALAADGW
jgi:hypothetical protein